MCEWGVQVTRFPREELWKMESSCSGDETGEMQGREDGDTDNCLIKTTGAGVSWSVGRSSAREVPTESA